MYKPWFGIVLESARLAVKILTLLSEEVRISDVRRGKHCSCMKASPQCLVVLINQKSKFKYARMLVQV